MQHALWQLPRLASSGARTLRCGGGGCARETVRPIKNQTHIQNNLLYFAQKMRVPAEKARPTKTWWWCVANEVRAVSVDHKEK